WRRDPAGIGAEVLDERQLHREVPLRHSHRAAGVAIDYGDGWSPVALARNAPVVQPVLHLRSGEPLTLKPGDDAPLGLTTRQAVELARVDEHAVLCHARQRVVRAYHLPDGQFELGGELEVAR